MLKIDISLHYTQFFVQNDIVGLTEQLKNNLVVKADRIFQKVQNTAPFSAVPFFQPSRNVLQRSIEKLEVNGKPFFENDGQCYGSCLLAIILYEMIKKAHPEISSSLILSEIIKEFSDGVGIEGAILQKFDSRFATVLLKDLSINQEKIAEVENQREEAILQLMKIVSESQEGAYLLIFPGWQGYWSSNTEKDIIRGHATAIFIDKGNYFFFDPNEGAFGIGRETGSHCYSIAMRYSPFEKASRCFDEGIEEIIKNFPAKKATWISKIAHILRETRADRAGGQSAYGIYALIQASKDKGIHFTQEEEEQLRILLCLRPGHMQVVLEQSQIKLHKYSLH